MDEVAEMHMVIAKFKHTIEIMRWHGQHNLNGMFAKESLIKIKQKISLYVFDKRCYCLIWWSFLVNIFLGVCSMDFGV